MQKYTPEEKNKCVEPRGKVQSRSKVAQQVAHFDSELAEVTTAWADLSDDTRRAILATVRASVAASALCDDRGG